MTFNWPTRAIPSSAYLKKQAKSQYFDVRLTLSAQPLTSFLIHCLILIAMASRRFTVDPAKKKKFLNFILQLPKLRVPDAMKLAMFSDKDIADLGLRRFLQRALPGGTVNAMKAHLAGLLQPQPPPPDCNNRHKKRLIDDVTILNVKCTPSVDTTAASGVAPPAIGTTLCPLPPQPTTNEEMPAALSMAVAAISRCKHHDHAYYQKKKARLAGIPPSLLDDTTTPRHGLMTLATAASAISPPDPWAINANGIIQTPCARRAAKSRMVQPAVRSIQHAGNTI